MKNLFKITNLYLLTVTIMVTLTACKKFVEISAPKSQLVASEVFADSAGANAAINGIYVNMMQYFNFGFTNGGITLYTGLSGDELLEPGNNNITDLEFYHNALTVGNSTNDNLWAQAYQIIYDANACIEGIKGSSGISASAKNAMAGEALVIRSFIYFNLVNLYGAVPGITGTDYQVNRVMPRTAINSIYVQIVKDLEYAQNNLPGTGNNTRANYYAATALLARVYLYEGLYGKALAEAQKIIGSGNYSLERDLNQVFLATSRETIWSFAPVQPGRQTLEGYYFVPTDNTTIPTYLITPMLYNSFESGDKRKADWINADTIAGQVYAYPYKYEAGTANGSLTENYVVFRLAEQYLIGAECKANTGDLAGALDDLNQVRTRAGLPAFQSNDKPGILSAILAERQHELFCEWGHRWYDLKRLGLVNAVLGSEKPGWKGAAALLPVPLTEIDANPFLIQNPGY